MSRRRVSIRDVVEGDLCVGCGACTVEGGGLSAMTMSEEGFLRPAEGSRAWSQLDAEPICPGIALSHEQYAAAYHPLWGPIRTLSVGHALDPEVRFIGSSGGVLSAIALGLIESGLVSFVWQTRADPQDPIGNRSGPSRTRADVLAAAGSRYGPSSTLADLESALATGETFAFIGKPCEIAALRKLAKHDERIDAQIPYKLSFFCAGVPSRRATVEVIEALNSRLDDVRSLRYRGEGWPGLVRVTRNDGSTQTMDYNASWGKILNRKLQFRCKLCPDGTGEFADIACADAWFGKDGYPDFEERDGRSLIVARTAAGEKLVAVLVERGLIASSSIDIASLEAMQPYQAARKKSVLARCSALAVSRRLTPRFSKFGLLGLSLKGDWLAQARNFRGTWRRLRSKAPR